MSRMNHDYHFGLVCLSLPAVYRGAVFGQSVDGLCGQTYSNRTILERLTDCCELSTQTVTCREPGHCPRAPARFRYFSSAGQLSADTVIACVSVCATKHNMYPRPLTRDASVYGNRNKRKKERF